MKVVKIRFLYEGWENEQTNKQTTKKANNQENKQPSRQLLECKQESKHANHQENKQPSRHTHSQTCRHTGRKQKQNKRNFINELTD